jgi:hypothetical protein
MQAAGLEVSEHFELHRRFGGYRLAFTNLEAQPFCCLLEYSRSFPSEVCTSPA